MTNLRKIELWTDGSSSGKSHLPTGWSWLAVDVETDEILFYGAKRSPSGSNNTAELFGAIHGMLECIQRGHIGNVTLVCDSKYVLGIVTKEYVPSKNLEETAVAQRLYEIFRGDCRWVRGHSTHKWNIVVDRMAGEARASLLPKKTTRVVRKAEIKRLKKGLK